MIILVLLLQLFLNIANNIQKEEHQFVHQVATMPSVSDPEKVSKYTFISSY